MNTFVSHLEWSYTGEKYNKNEIHNLSNTGKPLLVKYYLVLLKNRLILKESDFLNIPSIKSIILGNAITQKSKE